MRIAESVREMGRVARAPVLAFLVTALARGVLPSAHTPMRAVWPPPPSASYVDQQEIACRTHKLGSAGRVPLTLVGAPARGLPDGDTRCMRAVPDRRSAKTMGGLLRIRGGRGIDESGNGDSREGGKKGAAEKIGEMDPQVLEARWEEERAEALEEMGENDASRDLARVKMLEEMVLEFHRESGQTKTGEVCAPAAPPLQPLEALDR